MPRSKDSFFVQLLRRRLSVGLGNGKVVALP